MTQAQLVLAIDAGGTSTRTLVVRSDGTVLGRGRGGPGNHILSGWDAARASISEAVAQACAAAAVPPDLIRCAVAGSAGVGPNREGSDIVQSLMTELLPRAQVQAVGDMVTAFWGALDGEVGVVVASGTGSVCYGRSPSGLTRQVGGWGQVMGDEGSAFDIAVRALRAGAQATDGRAGPTALTEYIPAALGVSNFLEVAFRIYGEPMAREAIATLATSVYRAAAAGDPVARMLLADAGRELGCCAVAALRALDMTATHTPVAYTGAVFDAGSFVTDAFRHSIIASCPQTSIVCAEFPPVVGAFKLGLRTIGVPFLPATAAALHAALNPELA